MAGAEREKDDKADLRRGPWTMEEDVALTNFISVNGEGRWNSVARFTGLKRTGKSCRLRWLNYLRPDIRRGNITAEEQFLILELHSRLGNRWSKIARHLPGRTDNEIKNYWRTRVLKHARQLHCDVNSKQFEDILRHVWMPRLLERIQATNAVGVVSTRTTTTTTTEDLLVGQDAVVVVAESGAVNSTAGNGNGYGTSGYDGSLTETADSSNASCVYYNQELLPGVLHLKPQNSAAGVQDSFWALDEFW